MQMQRRMRDSALREVVEIGPEVAERMPLAQEPAAATVAPYVLTRGASRAWHAINSHLAGAQGALFWIAGQVGAGKTHFLNYVLALSASRTGALNTEVARYLTLPIEIAGEIAAGEIERRILDLIAATLAGEDLATALWGQVRGAEALIIALDGARRQGVKGVTIALDLGANESSEAIEILAMLAKIARASTNLRLIVMAAGRGETPDGALAFDVSPQTGEEIPVAVGRARRLDDSALRKVDGLYRNLDDGSWDTHAIYPLHPAAASALQSLRALNVSVGTLAAAVREVIEPWHANRDFNRLIVPAALMRSAVVRRAVDARLGEAGRAALKIATAAATAIANDDRACEITHPMIDTLVLNHLSGLSAALPVDQIRARLGVADGGADSGFTESLAALAARTCGVIVYDAEAYTASFNPCGAGAPEVAAFNTALVLARRFDPALTAAQDLPELKSKFKRLADAMASAIEDTCRNRDALATAMSDGNAKLSLAQQQAFAGFIELAESGPAALIEAGASQALRDAALATVAAYDPLALVAAAVPHLRLMHQYLEATNLTLGHDDDASGCDSSLAMLETECQMLVTAVNPAVLVGVGRNLDALEARFQKFKWTYVQHYRVAHEHWRVELERLAPVADDAHRHLEALRRLNAIAALGSAEGAEIAAELATLDRGLLPCDSAGALSPEVTPGCVRCGFRLGAISPRDELNAVFERARRALEVKFAVLAQRAIARLIRQHDLNHRLEGFLKIIQAAQIDALISVLDDQLADYLSRLLDEKFVFDTPGANIAPSHAMGHNLRAPAQRRSKINGRNGRNGRADKAPTDGN